ncbi:hypothetical protein ACFL50_05020 [Candidatus Latescibacterota bacterium]
MCSDLFKKGGPYNVQKTGRDLYEFQIPIDPDDHGRVARECPDTNCSPAYFKIKYGTGIQEEQTVAYCPYCRCEVDPDEFFTCEQKRYIEEIMTNESRQGVEKAFKEAFGIGPSGKKQIGGGMLSMELSLKPNRPLHVRPPFEEEVLRSIICPHCGLDHAVFGLAIWCPDCGKDIFMTHVNAEFDVVRTMLGDIERRRELLGPRIAARDIENCLEDTVSIFEGVLKAFLIRYEQSIGKTEEEIQKIFEEKIRTGFQNPLRAKELIQNRLRENLFDGIQSEHVDLLKNVFEKRHPITHNLGVIDKKYFDKAVEAEKEGREIRVSEEEIIQVIDISFTVLKNLHEKVFL